MKMKRHYSLAITLFLLLFANLCGLATDRIPVKIEFDHLTIMEGLPNNRVDCIIQDKEGYLWLGTKRGLARYNGYEFKTYTSILNDTTSLRYHQITTLIEDSKGTIWVGTWMGGLHKYDRVKDNFIRVDFDNQSHTENEVTKLFEDSKQGIWVAFRDRLFRIKDGDDLSIEEIKFPDGVHSISNVSALFEDNMARIYIASGKPSSLFIYKEEQKCTAALNFSIARETLGTINQIVQTDDENLWIASDNGLYEYNIHSAQTALVVQENAPTQGSNLNFILPTREGDFWIGGDGLYRYQKQTKNFRQFYHEADNPQSITGNIITCGFQDNQNNIWFGTFSKGINVVYNKTKQFNRNFELSEKLEKTSKNITAIYQNKEGYLFLGTWDKGLLILNRNNEFVQSDPKFSGLRHLSDKVVRSITADRNGTIWIGSGDDILTRFYFDSKQSKVYQIPRPVSTPESQITKVLIDGNDQIWVGNPTGVYRFDRATENFTQFFENGNTQDLKEDSEGNIWCANYNKGLCRINKDRTVSYFKPNGENTNLPADKFVSVFKDSKNRMWIGTEFNGLFLYVPETNQFIQFTVKEGLPSNDICVIQEDSKGRLWIGTNNGLSRFNYGLKDFSNYYRSDGMNADEFHYNSSFISESGQLFFGCTDGIVIFDPDDIRGNYHTFPIKLEEISVNYGSVTRGIEGMPIEEALRAEIPFQLKYNQNTVNFKYTTLNYSEAKRSNFAYQLLGLEEKFNDVGDQRQVTYTNLKPGNYVFKIIASNNDNIWDRKGIEIAFTIKNPPWLTWWAYLIYGFLLFMIYYALRLQVRHEEKMKAAIKLERMEKIQQKELNQMKLQFFTNISHEFKTPLTLIIGPLEQIISELHGNSGLKSKLRQISTNSQRLLELINQLIDFRKIEQDVLPLEKTRNDLVATLHKLIDAFNMIAIKNEITFSLDNKVESLMFYFDKDKVEKILTNLLSNSFKHTAKGGSITLQVDKKDDKTVCITLADTGAGIEKERAQKIFEQFSASGNNNNLNVHSSGIGLAYSKKLAELHGGSLELDSEVNKGTVVTVELPFDQETPGTISSFEQQNQDHLISLKQETFNPKRTNEKSSSSLALSPSVLIVEDDNELRQYIVSILADMFSTDEAADGQIAYEMALKNDYDLIVSDVMMPNMDGTQLCRKIKSNIKTSHIHVILLTAKSDITSKMEGYETGADSYLTKPFLPQHLMQVIKNLLNTRQHIKAYYSSTHENRQEPLGIHPRDKQFIANAIALIEKNIDDDGFNVETLGNELGLSRTHLFRKFKSLTGTAPNDFIRQIRLKRAAQLLKEKQYTISEIAYMVGFKIPANFSTSFKAYYGVTPKKFMEKE